MLKDGVTTCMEAWGVEYKDNTSLCHPWASAPIYMIAAEFFGLKPATPGWDKIYYSPHIPESMQHGALTIITPKGKINVSFIKINGKSEFNIKIPDGTSIAEQAGDNLKTEFLEMT